jgi:hypothetical protein
VVLAAVAGVATGLEPAAAATKPCWKRLINDWYDGRIDNVYTVKCYREAIKHLPDDVESYSDARADIERALLSAIRNSGGKLGPNDPVPAQKKSRSQDPGETSTVAGGDNGSGTPPTSGGSGDGSDSLLGKVKPANADSVPIPLLVLAGLALVLLAAASAGFAARRIQARRLRVSPVQHDRETR